ncbi:unnamed protein product [Phaedon cochleariae]|uniref:Elongation of very long chain fatty acids protein n=1 Tax=Phaedon cochleariae TaxID=80249 RepID=A0A9N9X0P8_PHACE|nr:unnamed protein product [Phaedon cochleariae]
MSVVLKNLYHGYFWIFDELSDVRTSNLLFSSPFSIIAVMVIYVHAVKIWGPKLMENRQPYNIKNIIMTYDILQILLNTYISVQALRQVAIIQIDCGAIDWSDNPKSLEQLSIMKYFFGLKLVDLVETIFFVLRKSYRQISFLHVYHHAGMVLCSYLGFRFFGGGLSLWLPMLNGFVHVVMFVYYFLTAVDSSWKQSTAFKRTLTQIQLIQFGVFIVVYGSVFFRKCEYPSFACYLFVPQNVFMILLFGDFYLKTYVFSKSKNVKNAK